MPRVSAFGTANGGCDWIAQRRSCKARSRPSAYGAAAAAAAGCAAAAAHPAASDRASHTCCSLQLRTAGCPAAAYLPAL
eukprot:365268-Chlamydomonas_euryale.AAC.3